MSPKKSKIAINGFGRIGRLFFRQAFNKFDIVAVNDLSDVDNLAYLLKYDTVYGNFDKSVRVEKGRKNYLIIGRKKILVLQEKDPRYLPWRRLKVDLAVEATGAFNTYKQSRAHLRAGAKKVVLTAPSKDEEQKDAKTVLLGVNEEQFKICKITSNGSCTTNASHPLSAIMAETVGIEKAFLNTIHGYTATQNLVDGRARGSDVRRGRAAAMNLIPTTSGASISVAKAITELEGKFDAMAIRTPVISGSLGDFTFVSKKNTSVEQVNRIFKKAARTARWKDILAVTDEPIVSSDIIGQSYGSIVDLSYTKVVGGNLVKVLTWYDNEWGYVSTLVKHVEKSVKAL